MVKLSLGKCLSAGALLALAPFAAQATHPVSSHGSSAAPVAGNGCGTTTIKVMEMVPTQVQEKRTSYKTEQKVESYTAYKYETVSETKTRQVTVYKKVTETVMEPRTVTVKVPVWEEKTEMVSKTRRETYTEMVSKTVDKGHYVTQEVPAGPTLGDRLNSFSAKTSGLFGGLGHGCKKADPCGDPCATSSCNTCAAPAACAPQRTKCVKVWVPCCVTEQVPVCKTRCVTECVPVCKKVCTYKCETKTEMVAVCKTKCVPECKTETYTECKKVCVPHTCTRTVCVKVPVEECVTVTKCVPTWVEKQVAVAPAASACDSGCGNAAACGCGAGLFSGLKGKLTSFGSGMKHKLGGAACGCGAAASTCGGCN